ncbi:MAG: hypothetical protein O7J95_17420 [Planctomycetota bacterium]|nr:hypothetical protein [Planctomycetota bacterium]
MRCSSSLASLGLACLLGPSTLPAAEDARTIELKMPQGKSLSFIVERESVTTFGTGERKSTSRVEYSIAAAGANDRGDRVFTVKYVTLKSTREGGQRAYEFDSTKDRSGGEYGDRLRRLIGKPIKATLGGGRVKEISGFPGQDRQEGRRRGRGSFSEGSLRRDLELILAAAVQGKALEKGKVYQVAPREGADAGRRRGFFSRPTVTLKYEGIEGGVARFALSLVSPAPIDDGDRRYERKDRGEGQATVSLEDGALLALKLSSDSSASGSFSGRDFTSQTKSTTHVVRQAARVAKARVATKVALRLPEGASLGFVVRRTRETSWGDNTFKRSSEIEYRLTASGSKGDARVFQLTYVSVKVKSDSRRNPLEFDSNDESSGDDFSDLLRRSIAKPITVTVAGGKIRDISGFPSSSADDGDRGARFRRFMVERIAGRRAVDRDVNLILAMAVHGQSLEKDKAYKLAPAPRPEGRRRRGFGFGRGDATVVYRFDGLADGGARFSLTAEYPPLGAEARERGARRKGSASGQALVSLKDGAVLGLELTSETEFSGEFQGREFRSTSREVTTVERSTAKARAKKKKKVTDL